MAPVVLFPDATAVVIDHLRSELAGRSVSVDLVSDRVPRDRPGRFVQVQRVGGPRLNLVADDALLAVECWAPRPQDAHDLAQWCRALILAMAGTAVDGQAVYRVAEAGGPQDFPDPLSDQPRYTFTVQVALRGSTP